MRGASSTWSSVTDGDPTSHTVSARIWATSARPGTAATSSPSPMPGDTGWHGTTGRMAIAPPRAPTAMTGLVLPDTVRERLGATGPLRDLAAGTTFSTETPCPTQRFAAFHQGATGVSPA